ncbi:hypothetical protein KAR91_60580, partial [Candidatus Pacearchaeota archaeon]|nr:hypothetical protein [Candidatus Pacearchaeota archaeon]
EKQKLTALQGQFSELLKKTQSLEKTVSGHTDPKVLRDTLEIAEKSAKEKESKNQDLQKQVSVLQKEKQDLLSKDDLSAEAMQQVQEKDKEIKRLENELISAKKKKAKYEGDFRFPSGGASLLSVPMGEGKVAEAMLYTPKQPAGAPPIIVTAITQDGKAVSVDFKKA